MESRLAESQHALAVLPQSHQAPRENGERRAAAQEAMPRLLHDPMTTNTHPKVTSGTPRGGAPSLGLMAPYSPRKAKVVHSHGHRVETVAASAGHIRYCAYPAVGSARRL